jgi:hypothetical protein
MKKNKELTEVQLREQAEKLKKERAEKCSLELTEILKKYNCAVTTELPIQLNGKSLKVVTVAL